MKRKIKLFLHHKIDEDISVPQSTKAFLKKCLFLLPNFLVTISYYIGVALISIFKFPKALFNKNNYRWPHAIKYKSLTAFLLLLVIAASPLAVLKIASEGQQLTGRVLGLKDDIFQNADSAQSAIKNKDYQLAQTNFSNVLTNLQTAQRDLDQSSILIQSLVKLAPDQYNTENILKAATLLTESGIIGSQILNQVQTLSITPEGLGDNAKENFANLVLATNQISEKMNQANELLKGLNPNVLPATYQLALKDTQSFVSDLATQMSQLSSVMDIADNILMQNKKFLIVLQNNNELRSTGGFIGTIAQGNFSAGSIKKLDIRSVYDLDGQLLEQVRVPSPMIAVNDRLYLRDSNWLINFPDSAKVLSNMYEKEGGETPDLVVSVNPEVFIELLKLTGPIVLPTYNVTLSAENFIETVQTTTSVKYDKGLNQPKQMLADLYPALLQKLNSIFKENPVMILGVLQKSLVQKDLLIYSKDLELQQKLEAFHWSGKVEDTDSDYLQIVSNNLSGTKTDRFIKREVKMQTTIDDQGSVINQVKYIVENPLPTNSGLTNKSWVRFLVPDDSKFIASEGFSGKQDTPEISANQSSNSEISEWENNLKFDQDKNIYIGREAGKTYFANWLELPAGQTITVTLTYQLPFKIRGNINHYSLLLQKQPGMLPYSFSQQIEYTEHKILWENISSKKIQLDKKDNSVNYSMEINQDQLFGLVLQKQ